MKRTDNEDGSYILTADIGRDLAVKDEAGNVIARAKESDGSISFIDFQLGAPLSQ